MVNWSALTVFTFFFLAVTVMGFAAAHWRRGDLNLLEEWGLAGRRFGTFITWFLVGGDFYTAYTVIAVPALVFGVGAAGFFALPYTVIVYPFVFLTMPRLWAVANRHRFVTPADFVKGRYGSGALALAVAVTGMLATMPYIALQLVGIQVVIRAMGIAGAGWLQDLPLVLAFAILAIYTYTSGLRAPALIAFVKDIMIYLMVLVAVTTIPLALGGYGEVFRSAGVALAAKKPPGYLILPPAGFGAYASLAFGSALAAFVYPHTVTSILSSSSGKVIRRNAFLLPAYTFLLGMIALLGLMALAAGVHPATPNDAVPQLFLKVFPSWFAGFCFAAIAIGALVPAAIMSIAAANTFTRNVYREYLNPACTLQQEAQLAKIVSLLVKVGALAFIVFLPTQYAILLQLLGGIWVLTTFPAIIFGLFTRWFHHRALLAGWLGGMISGTAMVAANGFKSPVYSLHLGTFTLPAYAGVFALVINIVVAVALTPVCDALRMKRLPDVTKPLDYEDEGEESSSRPGRGRELTQAAPRATIPSLRSLYRRKGPEAR
ncbi:monocarboxylate uptake permease MctP [Geomesophilobacter sediminis]|uniref:Sodium:solute symporter n=1 Tax=Geomesophilobacter sediminis TaxID=2798584 RepID=A0A8J7J5U6_9BACT|nr:sodium:solute symporter [Geomesophilobacter sediminis]MBJ6723926.1 sodium:solute symporter [Geomesophilobacter sediminis]